MNLGPSITALSIRIRSSTATFEQGNLHQIFPFSVAYYGLTGKAVDCLGSKFEIWNSEGHSTKEIKPNSPNSTSKSSAIASWLRLRRGVIIFWKTSQRHLSLENGSLVFYHREHMLGLVRCLPVVLHSNPRAHRTEATLLVLNTNTVLPGVFGVLFGRQCGISGPYPRKQCMGRSEVQTAREYS